MSLWNSVLGMVLGFVTAFKEKYPDVYNVLEENYVRLAWSGTKAFTIAQRFLEDKGMNAMFIPEKQAREVLFIKDGRRSTKDDGYDFILYNVLNPEKKYNSKRFTSFDVLVEFEMSDKPFDIAEKVKMLGLQIHQKDTGRKFEFNLDVNYFIDGNVLFDLPMVKFLLREHHNTAILDNEVYEITFIDQDMNVTSLTNDQHVIIEDGGYKVIDA